MEFDSWEDAAQYHIDFSFLETTDFDDESRENILLLKNYLEDNIQILQKSDPPVLVHNDLHFENILHEGEAITALFDFDFARQAPKEYELWHLIDFFHTPVYFVEKELERVWKQYEATDELMVFKKHYPDLFVADNLLDRVRLYLIVDIIDHAQSGNIGRSNHQVNSYFKTNWLEEKLGM